MMTWKERLIKLYCYISEDKRIQQYLASLRMSNNDQPAFTDEEVMTVYVFGIISGMSKVKPIYDHTRNYLPDWFPQLPSYQAFNYRLNQLSACFEVLVCSINSYALLHDAHLLQWSHEKVIDSVPIVVSRSNNYTACVAPQLCNKGYCASKNMYYYGLRLHVSALVRPWHMPLPEVSWITGAEDHDLSAARPWLEQLSNCKVYADKIYGDKPFNQAMQDKHNATVITPVKKKVGQQYIDAAADLLSTAVSKIRQPIESLFNWIIEKTQIQYAQRVRSEKGLLVHVWGKFAAALFLLANILTLD
jgi:Transposase DDE domain